ncbi:MAG: Gfo/Idh/MocA family oxidoreductase [Fuerstiella sp.]|nr:Gfo/Idh/MocA family oxidoreductase [Fuerstiella sp.]
MNDLQMAVVGVGSLGQHHARILAGMNGVQLAGVVDPRPEHGRQIAQRYRTQWYADVQGLPHHLDGVVIATPTMYHLEPAEYFLKAGVPTLVEKPLATSLKDANHLRKLADTHNTVLQVGHIERFNPAFEEALSLCDDVKYLRCQRVSPYSFRSTDIGVVHDLMIHDIDLALALIGELPESVEAFGAVTIGPHEDCAVARLRMPNSTIVDITSSRMAPVSERSMQIWSSRGCLNVDLQARILTSWEPSAAVAANPGMIRTIAAATPDPLTLKDRVFGEWVEEKTIQASDRDALTAELQEFVEVIHGKTRPRVGGREALDAMLVAGEVLKSLKHWSWQDSSSSDSSGKAAA